tara:strand:- start:29 stop:190 length:162 start_codon:yes stop_codon:yes gene_type:complete
MPQLGSEESPMIITKKKTGKVLGLTGSFYSGERKKKYNDNYDRIFGDKKNAKS